jgi:hypothetical protein
MVAQEMSMSRTVMVLVLVLVFIGILCSSWEREWDGGIEEAPLQHLILGAVPGLCFLRRSPVALLP